MAFVGGVCAACCRCYCRSRQAQVLARKRREYLDMVPEFYDVDNSERTEDEIGALRQVPGGGCAVQTPC
jgi:hypothetical protein